jgi:hypothetical protein
MSLRDLAPPLLWNWYRQKRYGEEVRYANRRYHVMQTDYSAVPLHTGRYAEIFERAAPIDPNFSPELIRYRVYNICQAARWALRADGDFLCAGVSFGVAPRTVFEFLNFPATGRSYHLLDPFDPAKSGPFNGDANLVLRQYPADAKIVIHRAYAPEGIPKLPLAFAHFDTSKPEVEAASLPIVYRLLSPGGIAIFDAFSSTAAATREYSRALAEMKLEPFWLPSGQIMITR